MPVHFEIPKLRDLARHALPHLLEATIIPLCLFYAVLFLVGVWAALGTGLAWSYACVIRRVVKRDRIPGILLLGTIAMTTRFVVAVVTGSVFVFYLQPTLGTMLVAGAFLVSLPAGRPLAQKLAADFCPLPPTLLEQASVKRFFSRITLLWAFVHVANAAATLYLLITQPVGVYVIVKTFVGWTVTGSGIVISTIWFKRLMARHGLEQHAAPVHGPHLPELLPAAA